MFKKGDAVVHPVCGAGVVVGLEELRRHGGLRRYYQIRLLGQSATSLMVPVKNAERVGLRLAISPSKLSQVWQVLCSAPNALPADHKTRYELLEHKLQAGDVLQTAEVVRDLAWRQQQKSGLTGRGKQIYQRGMTLLASEIAAAQGIELADATVQVRARLSQGTSPKAAV
ncbi:MAG TPA: hypothetical protein EYH30_01060 [Anaerolineales bacterium]|nr:hypothetical protein [Anaerolineales bacterium]